MTTIVNFVTSNFVSSTSYGAITNGISFLVLGILLVMLVEKVLLDAYEGKPNEHRTSAFTMIILPMLLVMLVVIGLRVAQVLHL